MPIFAIDIVRNFRLRPTLKTEMPSQEFAIEKARELSRLMCTKGDTVIVTRYDNLSSVTVPRNVFRFTK